MILDCGLIDYKKFELQAKFDFAMSPLKLNERISVKMIGDRLFECWNIFICQLLLLLHLLLQSFNHFLSKLKYGTDRAELGE